MLCRLCVRNIFHCNTLTGFFSVVVPAPKTRQFQIPYKLIVYLYHLFAVFARPGHFVHIYAVNEFPQQRCSQLTAVGMIDIPTEQEILAMMEEIRTNPQDFRFVA